MFLPAPYVIENEQLREGILMMIIERIWTEWRENTYLLPLLGALVIGDDKAIKWLIEGDRLI